MFNFDVVSSFLFRCRLPFCLMLLSRTELHSQDIINKKLQKAKAFSTNLEFIFFFIKYYYDLISESNQNFTVFNSWTILCPIFIIAEFF
jgi:hypothetical protein